jgi:NADPH:quinone reductase
MPVVGGLAETVAVDAHMVFPLPDTLPFDKGAALALNYLTVHFALICRARLKQGEIVLVHGAADGVGTAACQLAAAYGARVVAVVSTPAKGEVARAAGPTRSCRSMASATRYAGSPTAAAWTWSWIRSAASA